MIWLLRCFTAFTDLEALASTQAEALENEVRAHAGSMQRLDALKSALEQERGRRIAAETMASERRQEVERLREQATELRSDLARVNAERLRSLDALNVKLMRENVPEQAPDMEAYKRQQVAEVTGKLVQEARRNHRAMDMAILKQLHPQFKNLRPMNESLPPNEDAA